MPRLVLTISLALALAMPVPAAAACPPGVDRASERAELHTRLLAAETEAQARTVANRLWAIWLTAPDAEAQDLLARGMARRDRGDYAGATEAFDALVAYCPDYPEGYNQRAYLRFLTGDHAGSLADIAQVLADNPYHFGALSGRALNLIRQERLAEAGKALRRAVAVYPLIPERRYLADLPPEDI